MTQVGRVNGVHHTLTVWESEAAMRAFVTTGAHRRAIRAFPAMATGMTFGYETECPPAWNRVHDLWRQHGQAYGRPDFPGAGNWPRGLGDAISLGWGGRSAFN